MISVQHNSVGDTEVNYSLVLWGQSPSENPIYDDAPAWADSTLDELLDVMEVTAGYADGDRTFLGSPVTMLQDTSMIGIQTWASFVSNPDEKERLDDNDYLLGEAQAIFAAFEAFE
jgi:N-acetylmuramoyl-L-alanine amidase